MLFEEFGHVINMGMQEKQLVRGAGVGGLTLFEALLESLPKGVPFFRIVNVPAQVTEDSGDIAFEIDVEEAHIAIG